MEMSFNFPLVCHCIPVMEEFLASGNPHKFVNISHHKRKVCPDLILCYSPAYVD